MNWCKKKLWTALGIMGVGMLIALLFHGWQGWILGHGYPYNGFLGSTFSFTDYSDMVFERDIPDPYSDTTNDYLPPCYFLMRYWGYLPEELGLILFLFACLAGLTLLLIKSLEKIVENPWLRVGTALLLISLSYPILFCVDRGNTEILTALCAAGSLYYFSRGQFLAGTLCLIPAICWKPYLGLFLVFLLRRNKWLLLFAAVASAVFITAFCAHFFSGSAREIWTLYLRMMAFHQNWVYVDAYLGGSSSPWATYKVALIYAGDAGLIPPVEFDRDGPLLKISYSIYAAGALAFAAALGIYACFIEKEFKRSAVPFLLFMGMAVPLSADYRMIYTCIALAFLIPIRTKRPGDFLAVILLAFVLVPKMEIFLYFPDYPNANDVSIQVLLNPLCTIAAMALLLYNGCRNYDATWTRLRVRRFFRSLPGLGNLAFFTPPHSSERTA